MAAATALAILFSLAAVAGAQYCSLASSLTNVRPNQGVPPPSNFAIAAAGNEYESFQVVCAGGGALGPFTVETVSLQLPAGVDALVHVGVYYTAVNISDCNAKAGRHVDALVPAVDPFFGETRNAFPLSVPATESRVMWIDLFITPAATPGSYSAAVAVNSSAFSGSTLLLPFTLTLHDFILPQTSPFSSIFGYDGFQNVSDPGLQEQLAIMYTDLGLMHRVTTADSIYYSADLYQSNFTGFNASWGSFWRGRATPFGLANTTITNLQLPDYQCNVWADCTPAAQAAQVAFWSNFSVLLRSEGIMPIAYDYTTDEPVWTNTWDQLVARGNAVHAADPELRVLCTVAMSEATPHNVQGIIDLWVPIVNYMEPKYGCSDVPNGNTRDEYQNVSTRNLMWYQSCASHGCDGGCFATDSCDSGWPSYMIDHAPVMRRIMPWMQYVYQIGGELYWAINFAGATNMDEWSTQWVAGGNGDGTLTYRGQPNIIGGVHEIPIASVRMKHIRDAQEDLLYMAAAEAATNRTAVLQLVQTVASNTYTYTDDPATLLTVRAALADMIVAAKQRSAVFMSMHAAVAQE